MSSNLPSGPNKRNKHEPFGDLMKSMNDFFHEKPVKGFLQSIDDFFRTPFASFPIDVIEQENEIVVTAELPGIKKEQIYINVLDNYLTITVKNNEIVTEEDDVNRVYRRKQSMQQMSRSVGLSQPINESKVKASYQDGLLKIRIPRQKGKRINISTD
ncbi:Hsp20/alpha crystallin family protein [Cytobacillus sp. FJAT-54145]|uniref:Hsp20/alpha crystallin family protein n=1 Tax=Cytobacillus spartinae TaxID=3299023 RepID=A0ABW6KDD9_9BACI